MKDYSFAPVVVPQNGFAVLPQACVHLHEELQTPILTFACGASNEVREKLIELENQGQIRLIDRDHSDLLTSVEMRNLASHLVETDFILYLDSDVRVTRQGIMDLIQSAEDSNAHFASPMLTRNGRVRFGGYQLRSIHRANGDLGRLKLFDRDVNCKAAEVAPGIIQSDGVDFSCFLARTQTLKDAFKGWDERMLGLEIFDFALRARFHKLDVIVNSHVRFESCSVQSFDTADRVYRAFCSADPFRMLAKDAFEFKWSASVSMDNSMPRARKRDVFLRRSLQHRIDNALTRIARYQAPEPKSPWRELLLG